MSEPWPEPLFIPQDACILMNCTTDSPIWSIDLANDSTSLQLQFGSKMEELNSYGFYEIETPGTLPTLRLLINETTRNNGTVIYCGRVLSTTFSVFGKLNIILVL